MYYNLFSCAVYSLYFMKSFLFGVLCFLWVSSKVNDLHHKCYLSYVNKEYIFQGCISISIQVRIHKLQFHCLLFYIQLCFPLHFASSSGSKSSFLCTWSISPKSLNNVGLSNFVNYDGHVLVSQVQHVGPSFVDYV